jgi:hypothetical protein
MSKKKQAHPTVFLVPTNLTSHPVPVEAMNLYGSVKSGRGLIFLDQKTFAIIQ